ncbi:tripartite motif-containing protein 35 [Perca flavescens]|uniref:tripartite motif-containing protein 35 n=1 Tax=Perca flavescens TaxID=8167 RepID=UPI00106E2DFB|nr:tripartite motif-containing protein 35-like [Perca flavescens]
MSCQPYLPVFLHRAEAEGLTSTPRSADSPERCEEHEESLSMFCLDDLEPLCEQCAAVSHAGHRVYLLTEAATDCKEELRTSLNGLKKKIICFEVVTQTCQHVSRHNQAEAKLTEDHIKKDFESLHQFLREEEAARLLVLREEREEKKRGAEEEIDRMNQVIQSLEEKIQLVEEELDAGGDGVGFLEHYQDTMSSTRHREPQKVCRPLIDVAKHLGNLQYAEWEKMKHIAPYTPVTLDPRTAGQSLKVSPGLNSFHINPGPSHGLEQSLDLAVPIPANPERFHPYSRILAREGFESGLHCWDIAVGATNNWTIGVAAQSVSRKAAFEVCPEAGLWCISLREGEYRALTAPAQTLNSHQLSRVRVRLDWDEGTLDFTDADSETHLFTFRHRFTEKMYPFFESTALCGGFAVLAKRVNICVGSDYVPVEDTAITEEDQVMKSESCTEGDINASSTKTSSKILECGRLTEDKKMPICSIREEKKTIPQRCTTKDQLIKTKPAGKEKTNDNKTAAKKRSSKPRLNVTYHVSLNRAQQH